MGMMSVPRSAGPGGWPVTAFEGVPWESGAREGAPRRAALKARGPYDAAVPPSIADLAIPTLSADVSVAAEDAVIELSRFDAEVGMITAPFSAILLRSESAASSEIEQLTASAKSIALAELGRVSGANSRLIVGNVRAMEAAIEMAEELDEAAIIRMQAEILGGERFVEDSILRQIGNAQRGRVFEAPAILEALDAFAARAKRPGLR